MHEVSANVTAPSPEPISDAPPTGSPYQWLNALPKDVEWPRNSRPRRSTSCLTGAAKYGSRATLHQFPRQTPHLRRDRPDGRPAAAGLQKLGVKKGTKVGLFMPNCPTFIVYYFATLKAGGTVVNYNPLYTLEELTFQVKDSETELMVTLDLKLLFDKVEALMKAGTLKRAVVASFPALLPGAKSVLFKLFKGKELAHPSQIAGGSQDHRRRRRVARTTASTRSRRSTRANDIAVLQYTGGTTGTPKGAMLTHANVSTNCQAGCCLGDASRRPARSACWRRCRSSTCSR